MGIYPDEKWTKRLDGTAHPPVEYTWESGGLKRTVYYRAVLVIEDRTNCYCCSCPSDGAMDLACRNHGFAAVRPCENHSMPGIPYDGEMEGSAGQMPRSVQAQNAHNRRMER